MNEENIPSLDISMLPSRFKLDIECEPKTFETTLGTGNEATRLPFTTYSYMNVEAYLPAGRSPTVDSASTIWTSVPNGPIISGHYISQSINGIQNTTGFSSGIFFGTCTPYRAIVDATFEFTGAYNSPYGFDTPTTTLMNSKTIQETFYGAWNSVLPNGWEVHTPLGNEKIYALYVPFRDILSFDPSPSSIPDYYVEFILNSRARPLSFRCFPSKTPLTPSLGYWTQIDGNNYSLPYGTVLVNEKVESLGKVEYDATTYRSTTTLFGTGRISGSTSYEQIFDFTDYGIDPPSAEAEFIFGRYGYVNFIRFRENAPKILTWNDRSMSVISKSAIRPELATPYIEEIEFEEDLILTAYDFEWK